MKHLKKFEHNFNGVEYEENLKNYNFIDECIVEFLEKYKMSITNDENNTLIVINLPSLLPNGLMIEIKDLVDNNEKNLKFYKDIDYLIEKVCTNTEITHKVQLHYNNCLRIIFSWENESPF